MKLILLFAASVSVCVFTASCFKLGTSTTEKESVEAESDASQPIAVQSDRVDDIAPAKPHIAEVTLHAALVETEQDKLKVAALAKRLLPSNAQVKQPAGVTIQTDARGNESVHFRGANVFMGAQVKRTEVSSAGHLLILAQKSGEIAMPGDPAVESEGAARYIDPLGIWVSSGGSAKRVTPPNVHVYNAIFSPDGRKLAIAETLRDAENRPIGQQAQIVDLETGESALISTDRDSHDTLAIARWLSDRRVQIIHVGEAAYTKASTYEIAWP